jgi:hypothetical protein
VRDLCHYAARRKQGRFPTVIAPRGIRCAAGPRQVLKYLGGAVELSPRAALVNFDRMVITETISQVSIACPFALYWSFRGEYTKKFLLYYQSTENIHR